MIWLSTENASIWLAAVLGLGLALMIVTLGVLHWMGGREINLRRGWLVLFGTIAGALSPVTTFFLMLFKNVQHSHIVPDFSNEVMSEILVRTPVWALAGALIGGALMLMCLAAPENKNMTKPAD